MPRNMFFFHTQQQMYNRTKTVTRRSGWIFLKPNDVVNAYIESFRSYRAKRHRVPKPTPICQIRIIRVTREPLNSITQADVVREGFPDWTPEQFIRFYCKSMKVSPTDEVTRIEFEYINKEASND